MRDRGENYTSPEGSAAVPVTVAKAFALSPPASALSTKAPAPSTKAFAPSTTASAHAVNVPAAAGILECTVPAELAGLRVDQALARMFPEHSRSRLQAWLAGGHIRIGGGGAKPRQRVWGGERIAVETQPDRTETAYAPEALDLSIVYEDDAVIVIDKPAGLVVHPGSGNWSGTLANALLHHAPRLSDVPRAGVVHRLDKDTTGLMVVARTLTAQTALVRQLQARSVERIYLALVRGTVSREGIVDAPIGRDPHVRTRMAVNSAGKDAVTRYRVVEALTGATLLECRLSTGRTHQIRVHMASIGFPIVGDPVYRSAGRGTRPAAGPARGPASGQPVDFPRQALHAARLAFIHPLSGERVSFESPLPGDFSALLSSLRQ